MHDFMVGKVLRKMSCLFMITKLDIASSAVSPFEKRQPDFFASLSQLMSKCHLKIWKIFLICYVAMILKMKDSCPANLTF